MNSPEIQILLNISRETGQGFLIGQALISIRKLAVTSGFKTYEEETDKAVLMLLLNKEIVRETLYPKRATRRQNSVGDNVISKNP